MIRNRDSAAAGEAAVGRACRGGLVAHGLGLRRSRISRPRICLTCSLAGVVSLARESVGASADASTGGFGGGGFGGGGFGGGPGECLHLCGRQSLILPIQYIPRVSDEAETFKHSAAKACAPERAHNRPSRKLHPQAGSSYCRSSFSSYSQVSRTCRPSSALAPSPTRNSGTRPRRRIRRNG